MLNLILGFVGELLLQLLLEFVAIFLPELVVSWRKQAAPVWLKALSHAFWGVLLGILSLYLIPTLLMQPAYALANLILTPLLMGVVFVVLSKAKHDEQDWLQKARFLQGFLFAFGFALVRYFVI